MMTALHCAMLLLLSTFQAEGQVVDRMVAVVNKQIIMQSELEQVARVEFLLGGRPLAQLTDAQMHEVLKRMIDQDLLQQQITQSALPEPTAEEIAAQLHDARSQIPGAQSDAQWQAMLAAYGVSEQDVARQLVAQVRILRFLDLRFRGLVNVDKTEIATYYQEKFLPELRQRGLPATPLTDEVSRTIEKIVVEERIGKLQDELVNSLRSQARIEEMSAGGTVSNNPELAGKPGLTKTGARVKR